MQKIIKTQEEMIIFGKELASKLTGGDIVLLHGDLGAGKTTLTKGIAMGLGVEDEIVSPTFTLMQEYKTQDSRLEDYKIKRLVHIDTYRLENEEQLREIGVEDYLGDKETVCVIEWPEKIERLLVGRKVMNILIEHCEGGRKIKVENQKI